MMSWLPGGGRAGRMSRDQGAHGGGYKDAQVGVTALHQVEGVDSRRQRLACARGKLLRGHETKLLASPCLRDYTTAATTAPGPERHTPPASTKPTSRSAAMCHSAGGENSSVG